MAMKAKHAFGNTSSIDAAKQEGKIDSYDILFLDGATEPKVGWLDANGNTVIVDPYAEVAKLETQVEKELATKADIETITALETEIATKVTAEEVDSKVESAVKAEIEAIGEKAKYEITDVPEGTLVNYGESEIRIMVPEHSVFTKQNVGAGGDPNTYYMTFKTYVNNDNIVGYKERLGNQTDAEILTDFKTDANGRRYQPTWLGLAKYDETAGTWNYFGKNSSVDKYIGWDYGIEFYDANGKMIESDCIRINLSNEKCHSVIEPYYVGQITKDIDTIIEEKIREVEASYEIIEF